MNFMRRVENLFEKHIEGFFNNKFSSELQPVEIARQLIKEMEDEKIVGVSHVYIPNSYSVYIGKYDYDRIASYSQSISEELVVYLKKQADQKAYTIIGAPTIEFYQDEVIGKGKFRIVSKFSEPLPETKAAEVEVGELEEVGDTRVFAKLELESNKPKLVPANLLIVEGPDAPEKLNIGSHRINIGRRASNELPLTDMNTSRLQAYIIYEEDSHVIYDAKSLNGTYVNGHRILRKELQAGDKIKVGNTVILYEVK